MKAKYIVGILAVAGAMSLTSCEDFLNDNRYPLSQQTVNPEFWSNTNNVQNQINYFYEDYSGYGNGSGGGTFYWSWLSDDQVGRNSFNDWKFKSVPATSGSWTAPYTEIRRANNVIEGVESSSLLASEKENFIALARLHRARMYYDLVRRYGDVPLVTKALDPTDDAELFGPRTPRNEVMDFVLEDLDYACQHIAVQKSATTFSRDMALAFKVDVCLYEGSYAKYHKNDAARAQKFFGEVVKAGEDVAARYSINPVYLSLYQSTRTGLGEYGALESNPEIIFCKNYEEGVFMNSITDYSNASDGVAGLTKSAFEAFTFRDGLPAAKTSLNNSDLGVVDGANVSIANLLEVRDARLSYITYDHLLYPGSAWNFTNTGAMSSQSGFGVYKFNNPAVPATVVNEINKNYLCAPLFWGARVYVAILEAKAELGTITDADLTKYMKPLWDRALIDTSKLSVAFLTGINDPANNMGVSSLIWEVRRLRRCELMLDDDIRYWDLIRWKQLRLLDSSVNPDCLLGAHLPTGAPEAANGVVNGYLDGSFGQTRTFNEAYYLYPVPTNQIQLNDKLTQNPGWANLK